MTRSIHSAAVLLSIAALFTSPLLLADAPSMSAKSITLPISFEECRSRAAIALKSEGLVDMTDFGDGWIGSNRTYSASVGCARGDRETVVTVVVASSAPNTDRRNRLVERISAKPAAIVPGGSGAKPIPWSRNATELRGRIGEELTYECPSNGSAASVWGTDIYSDDSSICTAAVHAGLITRSSGGRVTIQMRPGEREYSGSARNGISSSSYGAWQGSYSFVGNPTTEASHAVAVSWSSNATEWRGHNGERHQLACPANGTAGTVWGSDIYTDDSSICTAAVHAGLISMREGGSVTIENQPGRRGYDGSTHSGITTKSYGAWSGSFVFVRSSE
jgi:LCCL domain